MELPENKYRISCNFSINDTEGYGVFMEVRQSVAIPALTFEQAAEIMLKLRKAARDIAAELQPLPKDSA